MAAGYKKVHSGRKGNRAMAGYFVLTLPLKTEKWQRDILDKRLEVNREIYNLLLKKAMVRYRQMAQTRAYRSIAESLKTENDFAKRKELYRERDALVAQYRLRKYDLTKDAVKYRQAFRENTDSPVVQNLAENVWRAVDRLISGKAREAYFKKPGGLDTVSGKTNRASILYRDGMVKWKGLCLQVVSKGNAYEREALQHEIKYCRIHRKWVRGKERYYVELVMEGAAPMRHPEILDARGRAGVSIGNWMVTVIAGQDSQMGRSFPDGRRVLAGQLMMSDPKLEEERDALQKFLQRSRRATNPQNYTKSGRLKAAARIWHYSNHYKKVRMRYRELCRLEAERRRHRWNQLVYEILALGDCFYIEGLDSINAGSAGKSTGKTGFSGKSGKDEKGGKERRHRKHGKSRIYVQKFPVDSAGFAELLERRCREYGKEIKRQPYRIEKTGRQGLLVS